MTTRSHACSSCPSSLTEKITEKNLSRRRLRFQVDKASSQPILDIVPPLEEELTLETARNTWYSTTEIASFKAKARLLILFGQTEGLNPDDNDVSGLERFTLERSRQKKSAIKCVLLAQRTQAALTPVVAHKCAGEAVERAVCQGFHDFCQVYDPLESLLGKGKDNYNETLFGDDSSTIPTMVTVTTTSGKRRKREEVVGVSELEPATKTVRRITSGTLLALAL